MHSLTKYIGGHGNSIGGIIVDGGNFDWVKDAKRQPLFNQPDPSYNGAIWGRDVPKLTGANVAFAIRARVVLLRDLGAPLSPFNAFQIIQGLETVALRMKQHCANAEKVVKFLETQKKLRMLSIHKSPRRLEMSKKIYEGWLRFTCWHGSGDKRSRRQIY